MGRVLWLLPLPCSCFLLVSEWPQTAPPCPEEGAGGPESGGRGSETDGGGVERCQAGRQSSHGRVLLGSRRCGVWLRGGVLPALAHLSDGSMAQLHLLWLSWQVTCAARWGREARQRSEARAAALLN